MRHFIPASIGMQIARRVVGGPATSTLRYACPAIARTTPANWRTLSSVSKVTPAMVKELREKTGSPMMDCKNALEQSGGDYEKAIEWLRKKGMATAAKKEARRSADGLICAIVDASGKRGSVVEVNSETDFVARNPVFQDFVRDVCKLHVKVGPTVSLDDFKKAMLEKGPQTSGKISVDAAVKEMVATVGENCQMRNCAGVEIKGDGGVYRYVHTQMGDSVGKVGVLVALESSTKNKEGLAQLGTTLAMHVAAGNPLYNTVADIPTADLEKEKNIYVQQAQESGKTREIAEKMTAGRIKKWHEEVVLHEQEYLLGGGEKKKVTKVLEDAAKDLGAPVKLTGFVRIKCGASSE